MNKTIFLHDNLNLIKYNAAAPSVMQCHAQEREPETCEPTPGPLWLWGHTYSVCGVAARNWIAEFVWLLFVFISLT